MKKKSLWAAGIALVMLLSVSLGSTLAYFTATAKAEGAILVFGAHTYVNEVIDNDLNKIVTVVNDGKSPVMVRVSIVGEYSNVNVTGNWIREDGYYYYNSILNPGDSTDEIKVDVDLEAAAQNGASFDIIINEEAAILIDDGNGNPTADWNGAIAGSGEVE